MSEQKARWEVNLIFLLSFTGHLLLLKYMLETMSIEYYEV